jgi:hypothetical protein
LVSAAFAVAIWAGNRSKPANRFLAFFLLLIAGNQIAEAFRGMATTHAARLTWFRIASVFAFLDPFFLYCFGSVFPEENRLHRPRWLAAAAAPLLVTVPGVFVLELDPTATLASHIVYRMWAAYTVVAYLVVFARFLHTYGEERTPRPAGWSPPWRSPPSPSSTAWAP